MDYDDDFEEQIEPSPAIDDEFKAAIESLSVKMSGIDAEALKRIARSAVMQICNELTNAVRQDLKKVIQTACGEEINQMAKDFMKEVFSEVVAEKVVASTDRWSHRTEEVKSIVYTEFQKALVEVKSKNTQETWIREAINSFVAKDMQKLAQDAILEFKSELQTEAKREATKALTTTLAKAVASDTRLTTLIQALEYNGKQ